MAHWWPWWPISGHDGPLVVMVAGQSMMAHFHISLAPSSGDFHVEMSNTASVRAVAGVGTVACFLTAYRPSNMPGVCEGENMGEERERERQTDREKERKTDRQTDRDTDRQTERKKERETDRQTDRDTDRQTHREMGRLAQGNCRKVNAPAPVRASDDPVVW